MDRLYRRDGTVVKSDRKTRRREREKEMRAFLFNYFLQTCDLQEQRVVFRLVGKVFGIAFYFDARKLYALFFFLSSYSV